MKNKNKGLTVIELLIATGLLSMLLLTISSLFITFMISSAKHRTYQFIKQEGNQAINQINFLLRNSQSVTMDCTPAGSTASQITITGLDGGTTVLEKIDLDSDGTRIASESSHPSQPIRTYHLTGSSTQVQEDPIFTCRQNSSGQKMIDVSFTLKKTADDNQIGDSETSQTFTTWVELRNQ